MEVLPLTFLLLMGAVTLVASLKGVSKADTSSPTGHLSLFSAATEASSNPHSRCSLDFGRWVNIKVEPSGVSGAKQTRNLSLLFHCQNKGSLTILCSFRFSQHWDAHSTWDAIFLMPPHGGHPYLCSVGGSPDCGPCSPGSYILTRP